MMLNAEYAIIVKSKTRLEQIMQRSSTRSMARFQIESQGGDFEDYRLEDEAYRQALADVQKRLSKILRNKIVDRDFVPSYVFKGQIPLIVVVGQDGLVANTAKYVGNIPVVAVNPEPRRYDGLLLPFSTDDFVSGIEQVISGRFLARTAYMAEARLSDGQRLLAFNDLFIGSASHVSARYRIRYGRKHEEQSSSGIIVSTKSGSTGWLSSVFNMTVGLLSYVNRNERKRNRAGNSARPELAENELFFAVREPFKSQRTGIELIAGNLASGEQLRIESCMPSGGVIFSDGIENDFLNFHTGSIASIGVAKETATLVQK